MNNKPLVSIIIPCYNQARFLGEAIESALAQTYPRHEVIVVDDGSTDGTHEVAAGYEGVECVRQGNEGLAAARNAGLVWSRGEYVVFLDADDRLLPDALEVGLNCLGSRPECVFAAGHYNLINADGSEIAFSRRPVVDSDHYLELLRRNYIGMHAAVMYRRSVFDSVGNFDASLAVCEDYDLYLRIARDLPVCCHDKVVAEYRQHGSNMSANSVLMLNAALSVLRSQWPYVKGNGRYEEAYRIGVAGWKDYYGKQLVKEARRHITARRWKAAVRSLSALLRHHPKEVIRRAWRKARRQIVLGPRLVLTKLLR